MKTGNVILAIFLFLCIPASFVFGGFFGLLGGGTGGGFICAIIAPIVFFLLGIIALITGMESDTITQSQQYFYPQQTVYPQQTQHGPDRRCPKCGRVIPMDANICPYCSKDFRLAKQTKHKFCSECGAELEFNSKFCDQCGKKV